MVGDFTRWGTRKATVGWIEDERGCHIWTGARDRYGYGSGWDGKRVGLMHRIRYEREIGPIPEGRVLDHFVCDNGSGGCCNPHHCRPVTHRENVLRGDTTQAAKFIARTHCDSGHELAGDNLIIGNSTRGHARGCRTCHNERQREYHKQRMRDPGPPPPPGTVCRAGHPISGDNLNLRRGLWGCRACRSARDSAYHRAKKQRQAQSAA